jgi:hypothetical protein
MVSAPKEAADKRCMIAGREKDMIKFLRSLILEAIPVMFQTHAVTL